MPTMASRSPSPSTAAKVGALYPLVEIGFPTGHGTGVLEKLGASHVPLFSRSSRPGSNQSPQIRSLSLSPSRSAKTSVLAPCRELGVICATIEMPWKLSVTKANDGAPSPDQGAVAS